jgi:RND superfamily putative drug exporter
VFLAPSSSTEAGQATALLPDSAPSRRAFAALSTHFAGKVGLSQAVIVVERTTAPLTAQDLDGVETLADKALHIAQSNGMAPGIGNGKGGIISTRSPKSLALPIGPNPLISDDGKAALILVNLPYDFSSTTTSLIVSQLIGLAQSHPFASGITATVTGSAGFGRDYAVANENSHRHTVILTLISVIVILLAVYRAPIAALIPLAGISAATIVALKLLACGLFVGVESGTAERIFVLVLVYGAGVDYSLLFISRYLELLDQGRTPADAVRQGLNASAGAILFSAATTIAGLGMLFSAEFGVFHNTGSAVVMALLIAAGASLTIIPALIAIIGPRAFWPGRRHAPLPNPGIASPGISPAPAPTPARSIWPAIANLVIKRPGTILFLTLLILALPSVRGARLTWMYDALSSLKPTYSSIRGAEMVVRHWPAGEVAPFTIIIDAPRPHTNDEWSDACTKVTDALRPLRDLGNIRGLGMPLGLKAGLQNMAVIFVGGRQVRDEYLSPDGTAMRLSLTLTIAPLTLEAMDDLTRMQAAAKAALDKASFDASVQIAGTTADMSDIRAITQSDFHRIAALALAAILLLVVAILLSLFMVAATVVSYLATLGITYWVFHAVGYDGLDWKLQIFLFIVLVAVGQDYNIFFAVRLTQELRQYPPIEATRQTLIHTGPVISCCGLIMAATLGSVMAGDITLLVQLGFAFALGMLIDTFIVRPLMLPAFIIVTRRTLRHAARIIS